MPHGGSCGAHKMQTWHGWSSWNHNNLKTDWDDADSGWTWIFFEDECVCKDHTNLFAENDEWLISIQFINLCTFFLFAQVNFNWSLPVNLPIRPTKAAKAFLWALQSFYTLGFKPSSTFHASMLLMLQYATIHYVAE